MTHSFKLRDYQSECVQVVERALLVKKSVLVWAPTASGKTLIFIELLKKWVRPNRKFIILVNRTELVDQTVKRLKQLGADVSAFSASYGEKSTTGAIIVASIQSVYRNKVNDVAGIVIDEAHNFSSESGMYSQFLDNHDHAKVIGFTATPWSNNKRIYGEGKFFDVIDYQISLKKLIDDGYIVKPSFKCPPHQIDTSVLRTRLGDYANEDVDRAVLDTVKISNQILDALPRLKHRKKILWVCASIKHAEKIYYYLKKVGEKAQVLHSKLPTAFQDFNKQSFEKFPEYRHMCCVMMATEGYDYPAIDAVCFMRPTKSATLFTQVIGRALRLYQGKEDALVLDYGRVLENCGPLGAPKIVSNDGSGLSKVKVAYETWVCPKCLSPNDLKDKQCLDCGYEKPVEERDVVKNTTETAASYDDIILGREATGAFNCKTLLFNSHVAKSSNNKSIKLTWVFDHGEPHKEYITKRMWSFRKRDFHNKEFQEVFDDLKKDPIIQDFTPMIKVKLSQNNKGFYRVKVIG